MRDPAATIPIHLCETHGIARVAEPVRTGVPLPRGWLPEVAQARLRDADGRDVPAQCRALASWGDGSVKWLLVDALVTVPANSRVNIHLVGVPVAANGSRPPLANERDDHIEIDTGVVRFDVRKRGATPVGAVAVEGRAIVDARGLRVRAIGPDGKEWPLEIARAWIEEHGPIRSAVVCEGKVGPVRLTLRFVSHAGSGVVRVDCEVWNPRAALHAGGLWDLGDPASAFFKDLSIEASLAGNAQELAWRLIDSSQGGQGDPWQRRDTSPWTLYQDSSGGERWNSPNHLDRDSKLTVTFRGFRVYDERRNILAKGDRATPVVMAHSDAGWISATAEKFWQNFPKALRWDGNSLGLGLFPAECAAGFELQGGEKKRHTMMFEFGLASTQPHGYEMHAPLEVSLDPAQVAASAALGNLLPQSADLQPAYAEYVASLLEGPDSCVAKREIIDEYGWRNFGDLYADHEAVRHQGAEPFVSHYNNQYDFVYGAALNFLRSADPRWRELMIDAARHHVDIDIYHTQNDRPAFNGGLFWHTDHHKPAATCTHRTYSRHNAGGGAYGGGPSNEHDYSSGLMYCHFLTGDTTARDAVLELADWVLRMDDGSLTLFGVLDRGPTGAATATIEPTWQKAGRGAGNSINTLLDAYTLSGQRHYLSKAEEFVQRCIHPHDDIPALGLSEPEFRWSYLVFLQVVAKYLDRKRELGEYDYAFHFARESLVNYAAWMCRTEVPYKDVLHKVLLPTETWSAHDIRKSHVLLAASLYAPEALRDELRTRAEFFFQRCIQDLLTFPTARLTRPQVLLCVYAVQYAGAASATAPQLPPNNHSFGEPRPFVAQRQRTLGAAAIRLEAVLREGRRVAAGAIRRLGIRS